MGMVARTGVASPCRMMTMNKCRRAASITISTKKILSGSVFKPILACRRLGLTPSIPLFNATSPQPLYSFASGYTRIFSQNLVNYFNPAFSWYESLFGPVNLQKTLAAFPIVLQGSGANAPFTTLGGLDNTWPQGRRATRFHFNDDLAWSLGTHELRFGVNSRILRLNDYDFGEGTVPLVNYATLPQFIYGVASTATETFPLADSQPFNFLNLDVYAQDTWKVTPTLTWTLGIRDTYNSNPLNPHHEIALLPGSFGAISHNVNQPLNALIQTHLGDLFASTPLAILQPRTALAWQFDPNSVLRTGFGLFSDILPGSIADVVGFNPPYVKSFEGGLLGTVGGTAIAPGVPNSAVDATAAANQTFSSGFPQGSFPVDPRCGLLLRADHSFHRSLLRRYPTESCMRLTSCNGVLELNISLETRAAHARNTLAPVQ